MSIGADQPSQTANHRKTALVEIRWSAPILTVRPAGPQIGQRESPIVSEEVMPFLERAGKSLKIMILDLSDVTFMSSMGLGICISFRNKAAALGGKAILYGASRDLLGLLSMMKIEKLYTIAKSEDELKKHLSQ